MFDPDDYELHEAQKHGCKMARERDEARVMADRLTAELAECDPLRLLPAGRSDPVRVRLRLHLPRARRQAHWKPRLNAALAAGGE